MIHASSNRKSCLLAASLAAVAGTALAQETARTTWQQEEQITDAVQECSYYDFPALDPIVGSFLSRLTWRRMLDRGPCAGACRVGVF